MKYNNILKTGYFLVAVLVTLVGLLGIYGTQTIVNLLKGDDEHLRSRILHISSLSMNIKNAETDVTMYLLLQDQSFKKKYFMRLAEVRNSLDSLRTDVKVETTQERYILNSIENEFGKFVSAGQALLAPYDSQIKSNGDVLFSEHGHLIKSFFGLSSEIRRFALKLGEYETDFLNRQAPITASLGLASYSKRLQGHLLIYLLTRDKTDRAKVFDRYQSCWEMFSILEDRLNDPESRKTLLKISQDLRDLMSYCQKAIEIHESDISNMMPVNREDDSLIRNISEKTQEIVKDSTRIAEINVMMEISPKQIAIRNAYTAQAIIIVVTIIPVVLAFVLGYAAHRKAIELEESHIKLSELNNKLIVVNHNLENEIIERKDAEEQKSRLIIDLQSALAQVKTLSGLIPICSSCKKIRDDRGFWQQVEVYVRDHSEAEFSHSICPDCLRELYPEIADEILGRSGKNNTGA